MSYKNFFSYNIRTGTLDIQGFSTYHTLTEIFKARVSSSFRESLASFWIPIKLHFNVGSLYDYIYAFVHTMLFKMNRFKLFIYFILYNIVYIRFLSFMNQLKFKFEKKWYSITLVIRLSLKLPVYLYLYFLVVRSNCNIVDKSIDTEWCLMKWIRVSFFSDQTIIPTTGMKDNTFCSSSEFMNN